MQSLILNENFSIDSKGNVVTIGSFDGIHSAHQKVIRSVLRFAKKQEGTSIIVTFTPHPLKIVNPAKAPKLLTTDSEKKDLIRSLNIDYLLFLKFNKELAKLTPQEFIEHIILDKLKASTIVVGYDHGFGKKRSGNVELLNRMRKKFGFEVKVVSPKLIGGAIISSTSVRNAIYQDDWQRVFKMLKRYYSFSGKVVYGVQRGNFLDFPTANLEVENKDKLIPNDGVYAVWVLWRNAIFQGAMNIGKNPTFGNNDRSIEIFIIDFSEDIYGEVLTVLVVDKIRSERKFPNIQSLKIQIEQDVKVCKKILNNSLLALKTPFFRYRGKE